MSRAILSAASGETGLFECESAEEVETLVALGFDVNARGNNGSTPLIRAASHLNTAVVKALIAADADVNVKGCNSMTALHWACNSNHLEITRALIAVGADVTARERLNRTPLDFCMNDEMKALFATVPEKEDGVMPLLDVVGRAHTLLKTAKEQATGTPFIDANTDLANTLYQTALDLLKTAIL